MERCIVGFSGRKLSGKTTAVHGILETLGPERQADAIVLGFFSTAKDWFRQGCGLTDDCDLENQDVKETRLPCGLTIREALQRFGTDYCRSLDPDWWVNVWKHQIEMDCKHGIILVPDVRFPNELKVIQRMGGHVIRFLRAPFAGQDQHESETALDEVERLTLEYPARYYGAIKGELFDACVDNREMSIPQQNEAVLSLVKERGWIDFAEVTHG